ncbi:MAG: hypothetical protein ACK4FB_10090 [Brevundimonas sp.]|uniref:hypothetical protein n=1 Tax=Brevundimonas sp. TaxID=1871086 RepID=UPI00391CFD50
MPTTKPSISPEWTMSLPPPLLILTEGDRRRGLGHLGRCLGYAAHWRGAGRPVRWIVDGDEAARIVLGTEAVQWRRWQDQPLTVAAQGHVVIVDSYDASPEALTPLAASAALVICLDDLARDHYPPGLVVHTAPGRLDRSGRDARWLIGPRWQPMPPAFWDVPDRSPVRPRIGRSLVLTGGTDLRGLGTTLAGVIRGTLPDCRVDLVLGAGAMTAPETDLDGVTLHRTLAADALRDLMLACDVAVSAAGQTLFQLARCGTPAIMVGVADNQARHLREWPRTGAMTSAGEWNAPDLEDCVAAHLHALASPQLREAMSQAGRAAVDGQGVARLAREIEASLV